MDSLESYQLALGSNFTFNDTALIDSEINENLYKQTITYYMMGVAGMTLCCLGIIGNILSVIVLTRKTMRTSTYSYLCALAACDTLVLFCTMLLLTKDTHKPTLEAMTAPNSKWYVYMFPVIHPAAVSFQVTSIWLTLAFTVDRYIMICHPFKAERMCNVTRARMVIVGLYIAGLIFNIPRFLEYRTKVDEFMALNQTTVYYNLDFTEIGKESLFKEIVHSWMYLTCVCGIPFLSLAVLNTFLIRAVHLSRKKGREINAVERRRNDTTVMLIGVVLVFFVCQVPALIGRMIWAFDATAPSTKEYYILNEVGNLLVLLNSAINIVPYYFFGNKFRKEFGQLFCWCFMSKNNPIVRRLSLSFEYQKDLRGSKNSQKRLELKQLNRCKPNVNCSHARTSVDMPLITSHNNGCLAGNDGNPMTISECNGNCRWLENGQMQALTMHGAHRSDSDGSNFQDPNYCALLCVKFQKNATQL
ncbi:FMRFamide receptor-like [Liolophura sinensis]|uniref:FMRFamide receptor-like n=1 Tax=Liolophura sinensis TaxID=3198878 RepID=UPI0031583D9B